MKKYKIEARAMTSDKGYMTFDTGYIIEADNKTEARKLFNELSFNLRNWKNNLVITEIK